MVQLEEYTKGVVDMDVFFRKMINSDDIELGLYDFQKKTADLLLGGHNVFLSAPTGSGKTWAALVPYLYSRSVGQSFVDRVIYALPLRSLADSLYESTVAATARVFDLVEPWKVRGSDELAVTIQTGERSEDQYFLGDVIFTTIDQVLSNYLQLPLGLPVKRYGNLNPGALVGSLIVFDEMHLLDEKTSLGTTLDVFDRMHRLSQFVIMTATYSDDAVQKIASFVDGNVVKLTESELENLPSYSGRQRSYCFEEKVLTADDVLAKHRNKTIVIVNTVARAQALYEEISSRVGSSVHVKLLHSRFFGSDRKVIERGISPLLGPDANDDEFILITTQVVEAGMDISADNLLTELAPANALVQRAGRCARYPQKGRGNGTVTVYDLPVHEGNYEVKPYNGDLVDRTREKLQSMLAGDPRFFTFTDEKELVDSVHSKWEIQVLSNKQRERKKNRAEIDHAIDDSSIGWRRKFVRDIDSVSLILANDPNEVDWDREPELLSVSRRSLFNLLKGFQVGDIFYPVEREDAASPWDFDWIKAETAKEVESNIFEYWLLTLSPRIATYRPDIGLVLGRTSLGDSQVRYKYSNIGEKPKILAYEYKSETIEEHMRLALRAWRTAEKQVANGEKLLAQYCRVSQEDIKMLVELAILFHDVGKLNSQWQTAVRAWQNDWYADDPLLGSGEPLAHSTYIPEVDKEHNANIKYTRGPHALEGAYAIHESILSSFFQQFDSSNASDLASSVLTAIARHHGAYVHSATKVEFAEESRKYLNRVIRDIYGDIFLISRFNSIPFALERGSDMDFLMEAGKEPGGDYLPLYWFIVRQLRLADQRSQNNEWEEGNSEYDSGGAQEDRNIW